MAVEAERELNALVVEAQSYVRPASSALYCLTRAMQTNLMEGSRNYERGRCVKSCAGAFRCLQAQFERVGDAALQQTVAQLNQWQRAL